MGAAKELERGTVSCGARNEILQTTLDAVMERQAQAMLIGPSLSRLLSALLAARVRWLPATEHDATTLRHGHPAAIRPAPPGQNCWDSWGWK
jgi:hypothetical protein